MAGAQLAIRRRIRSVQSTLQITKAMELVATSRLQKLRNRMDGGKVYSDMLYKTMSQILTGLPDEEKQKLSSYLVPDEKGKPVTVIFGADSGMCGAYNANLDKFLENNIGADDLVIVCGNKPIRWLEQNGIKPYQSYPDFDRADVNSTNAIAFDALDLFEQGKASRIRVVYTEFVNAATFEPRMVTLLPVESLDKNAKVTDEVLVEPDPAKVLRELIPLYVRNLMYSYMMRAKTSEQGSRRLAMETATDNAQDLEQELQLAYNKARQGAITQEITEITSSTMSEQ